MAYTLRYYKTLPQPGDRDIILEIYEKDGSGVSMEIGPVIQSLHLDIQGSQDDIDTPIIKTSLVMSFVDAPDHEEASSRKCGDWTEFYTPDSTYWKVVLKARDNSGTFSPIWGGYVTPDSFSEQLRYRGSVTIVARDNIGHLQDFPFDAKGNEDGMITVYDLVNAAWAKIESPMSLDWRGEADGALWLQCDGTDAPSTYVNVSAFEGKNWYEVVESILYSMGMTMRYIGINIVQVASLRYMQYQGKEKLSDLPRIEPKFIAYANRELAPAARRIEESVKYDLTDGKLAPLADDVLFSGVQYTSPFISENVFGEQTTYNIPVWPIANTEDLGWSNIPSSTLFLDPGRYNLSGDDLIDDAERMLFIAGNTGDSRAVTYGQRMACTDFRLEMRFGRVAERFNTTSLGYAWFVWPSKFRGYVSVEQNGITQFYTGSGWQTESFLLEIDIEEGMIAIDVPLADFAGSAVVKLTIQEIVLGWKIGDVSDGQGLYVAISSLRFASVESSMLETNRVNTNYDESNNVIISRNPEFAPAYNEVPFPQIIKNGIFLLRDSAYVPAKGWSWPGGTPQQMAVYNHLQLLCYYAKPNNVITGDIVNANLGDIRALYLWHGREHLLQGGSLNFLNGRIEGAILREFTRYESIWGDVTGDSGLPEVEQSSGTTAESSSSPSSDGYNINTEIYLGGGGGGGTSITIDTEMSDSSRNAVENRVIKAYVDGKAAEAQGAAEQYIQNEVLTDYATTKYVEERDEYVVGYAEGLVNTLESDIDSRGYLTSAAMTNYATKNDIKDFVTKGTTLAHYGITDAVRTSATFSPTDNPNVMGYGKIDNGWPNVGPSMIIGTTGYYLRVNSVSEINDSPKVYVSNVYNNTECGWAQLITDKNFNQFGISVLQNLADDADTLASPSVAGYYNNTSNTPFNFGNILTLGTPSIVYKTQIAANVYGRIALRSYNNAWTDWYEILTSNNIGGYALTQTNADARYLKLSGGTLTGQLYVQNSAGDRYIHSECDTAHIAFGVGSGGNNRGIFDINDGKWWIVRNNSDYTEIVSSTMSLVGKVNVTGLLEARSGITLGNVTRTSWPAEGIAKNSILLPNNAFDNFGKIQFSQLDNALYAAAHRFNITLNGFNSDSKGVLFNGSYEDSIKVPVGQTATIRIDNNGNYIIAGHPYGKIVLSFYYQSVPASVSVRVYDTYGTPGWYTLSLSEVRGNNGGVFVFDNTSYYGITEIEITITAKADIEASLAEIDWFLTRASLSNLPVVTKFAIDQELYGTLICKGGITLGSKTITSWDDIKASGDYLPSTGGIVNGAVIINGTLRVQSTVGHNILFDGYALQVGAGLYVSSGYSFRLGGESITSWEDLKTILGLKSLAYKDSIAFSEITSKPTTLSGYGITDAYTRAQVDALIANVEGGSGSGTGNITIDSALSETSVNPVQNNVITANINRINASLTSVNTTLGSLRSLAYKEKVDWDTDIENIPDDLGGEIKVVSQTATSGTVGINPNVINKWGSLSSTDSFTIAFNDGEDGVANYYMLEFKMTATSPTITLPDSVVWANGYNVLENITSNRAATCQISILDGLAVGAIFYDE